MSAASESNPLADFYEAVIERALRRVLDEQNARFPAVDAEIAAQLAKINAKINITVPEASLLLGCSESHFYTKIAETQKGTAKYPIPFLNLDGVYVFPREKLIAWAEKEKARKTRKSLKSENASD